MPANRRSRQITEAEYERLSAILSAIRERNWTKFRDLFDRPMEHEAVAHGYFDVASARVDFRDFDLRRDTELKVFSLPRFGVKDMRAFIVKLKSTDPEFPRISFTVTNSAGEGGDAFGMNIFAIIPDILDKGREIRRADLTDDEYLSLADMISAISKCDLLQFYENVNEKSVKTNTESDFVKFAPKVDLSHFSFFNSTRIVSLYPGIRKIIVEFGSLDPEFSDIKLEVLLKDEAGRRSFHLLSLWGPPRRIEGSTGSGLPN
jgi:hypothetical protein